MHVNFVSRVSQPQAADHGLRNDLQTLSLFFTVLDQFLAFVKKGTT